MKIPMTCKCGCRFNAIFDDTATGVGVVRCPKCQNAIRVELPKHESADNDSRTIMPDAQSIDAPGLLLVNGREYNLEIGDNIVGRKAHTSSATIQLDVNDPYMSRQHVLIRVLRQADGSLRTFISNAKAMNGTMIDGVPINDKDMIVLQAGAKIKMGDTIVVFKQ